MDPPEVFVDVDGAAAVAAAVVPAEAGGRTAIWVGEAGEPALAEFVAEIGAPRAPEVPR